MASRPPAYNGSDPYVFISYSHKDAELVYPIIEKLQEGLRVWYDQGIEVGSKWSRIIAQHLIDCTGTICFVTSAFLESENCLDEIFFAKDEKKHLLIVYLDTIKLPPEFRLSYGRIHALNLLQFPDTDALIQAIIGTEILQACRMEEVLEEVPVTEPVSPVAQVKQLDPEELYNQGKEAYEDEDYDAAVPLFQQAAGMGYAPAQHLLGECYDNGFGVADDEEEAFRLYKLAADQNYAPAQNDLGECYYYGYSVEKDSEIAFTWFKKAADQGYAPGQRQLGACYERGSGTKKDKDKAFHWYTLAAEQGDEGAQHYLGDCYFFGTGTKADFNVAVQWYRKAAAQNDPEAQFRLGICHFFGIAEPQSDSLASELVHKAAEQRSYLSRIFLEYFEVNGVLPALTAEECLRRAELASSMALYPFRDMPEIAFYWNKRAAEYGSPEGFYRLGKCYEDGKGIGKDLQIAVQMFRKAAEQGHVEGQYLLGYCYRQGQGVEKDENQYLTWTRKAAEQGYVAAMHSLGIHYEYEDSRQSTYWYRKAAEAGHASSQHCLGSAHFYGNGTYQSYSEAVRWFQKAVDQGYPCHSDLEKAQQCLQEMKTKSKSSWKRRWF